MPRIRSIYPEACRSRKLAALTPAAERCWWRLQCHLDDHGRAEDEPDIFASVLFQVQRDVTPGMVDRWLWEMAEAGLIVRYTADETDYIEVVRWGDFQHPQKPKKSTIPPAQDASTRRVRDGYGDGPCLFEDGWEIGGEGESEGEVEHRPAIASPVDNPLAARVSAMGQRFSLIPGQSNPAASGDSAVSSCAALTSGGRS